ncbi:MAG: hypothetical protein A3B98_00565 [Candidatus Taylorbacteria bacterium RIFCSPHIGHO2_02_FULL_43_55]|nr:MAG: hypothetical protein A3B98_00565 [Candidatus Taylorbacteria bacterium RIFCSPHIGHO2_02_FULL_43_55]OHA28766.1 MAG: hypothetical protein A3E92_03995 [Candidatus Taylorbacteria bacterium RIFCSPHIGHO2_12_FULL_42_34]OHA30990.1 MAG: hypothetical protein A3B09_02030 [Candidatus Taylorbacteria bacterium RIFCSPLOWO2_01_FULL_43_83]OHA39513.1 MAG: hypothetical protein A3H58_02545 [Candidatus Taylorbacteria bacterium RIFCSPLOWO2_02_FULL_43_22b]
MSKSNDNIFNELEILEEYAHMAPYKAFSVVEEIYKKSPQKPSVTHLKGFGKLYGKRHEDLLSQCVKVLNHIRYLETKRVFRLLEKLHQNSDNTVQSESTKAIEMIAQYNLFVLQQVEYRTQDVILGEIEKWSKRRLSKNSGLVLTATKEMLEPTFEGHSMPDYKTFTLHSGPLVVTDALKSVRKRTIALLTKLYGSVSGLSIQARILLTLQGATQTPHSHLYGDDLEQMVLEDTNDVIDFYLKILPTAENELIQDIEEQKIWFTRRFTKIPPRKLEELDEAIKANSSYNMFRVFVGYDGRLDPDYDFDRDKKTRTEKVHEFVNEMSSGNFDDWKKKILTVVKNYSGSEPGSYGYFEIFLLELGKEKPDLAIRLIESNEKELAPFLLSLLSGIWRSDKKSAEDLLSRWINEGKYLHAWGFFFVAVDELDSTMLRKVFEKAKSLKDTQALNNVLRSILHHYPKNKNLKSEFIKVIRFLSKLRNTWWVNNLWFKGDSILGDLSEEDWESVLEGLLLIPTIDYHAEEILRYIAEKKPERVISFFHDRVEIKSKKKRGIDDRYDGVPFNFHKLGEVLKPHAKVIVPILLGWYDDGGKKHNWLYQWEASHMFEEIFPALDPVLEQALISVIKKGTKNSRRIVFSVLGKYEGGSSLWGIVRAMIKQYAGTKEYEEVRGHLFGYLSQTGVVTGEDGFVRAFESKKTGIQALKDDPNKAIKKFAKEYEEYLDNRIVAEQKRTDEQIELMKRGLD